MDGNLKQHVAVEFTTSKDSTFTCGAISGELLKTILDPSQFRVLFTTIDGFHRSYDTDTSDVYSEPWLVTTAAVSIEQEYYDPGVTAQYGPVGVPYQLHVFASVMI